jgi:hypothetical protein
MAGVFQTSTYRSPVAAQGASSTLKALEQRQKEADAAAAQAGQMTQPVSDPLQGVAYLGNILATQSNQARTENESWRNRNAFASVLRGVDPNKGPTNDQVANMYLYNPDEADKILTSWDLHRQGMEKQTAQDVWQGTQNEADRQNQIARTNLEQAGATGRTGMEVTGRANLSAFEQAQQNARNEANLKSAEQIPVITGEQSRLTDQSKAATDVAKESALFEKRLQEGITLGLKGRDLETFAATNSIQPPQKPGDLYTPLQQVQEQAAGKDDYEFRSTGAADAVGNIQNAKTAVNLMKNALASGQQLTGGYIYNLAPDGVKPFISPDTVTAGEMLKNVVQSSLKATLGSQFTEKESTALLSRTFNPSLSTEENLRRAEDLLNKITAVAQQRAARSNYIHEKDANGNERGNSIGFQGAMPDFASLKGAYGGDANYDDTTGQGQLVTNPFMGDTSGTNVNTTGAPAQAGAPAAPAQGSRADDILRHRAGGQ